MPTLHLRIPETDLAYWAARYEAPVTEEIIETQVGPATMRRGYLTREDFLLICRWKTPRSRPRCEQNTGTALKETTVIALGASTERLKIGALLTLSGVSWPTASVILHFCDRGAYPILDFRVLWTLGLSHPPTYSFEFWETYLAYMRALSARAHMRMRRLDKALWQYSKERQPARTGV